MWNIWCTSWFVLFSQSQGSYVTASESKSMYLCYCFWKQKHVYRIEKSQAMLTSAHDSHMCNKAVSRQMPEQIEKLLTISNMTNETSRFSTGFQRTSVQGSAFIFLQWFKLAHICIQVTQLHRQNKHGINFKFLIGS